MRTSKALPKKFAAFLCLPLLSACATVKVKDTTECVIAGVFQAGMDCATTNSSQISEMDFEEMILWLEAQPERPDPLNAGKTLPSRAGAVCRSDEDFTAQKIALESACALLKNRCIPEVKAVIENMNRVSGLLEAAKTKQGPL